MSKPVRRASRDTLRTPPGAATPAPAASSCHVVVHSSPALPDSALIVRAVPHLAPETLHQLIRYRGLDASGDILSAVTPGQMAPLLDLELWQPPEPAGDARFDPARFGEWVVALVETGEAVAARVVAEMDERLVVAGLSRFIRVFDPAALARLAPDDDADADDERGELAGDVGGYVVWARTPDWWDAIFRLLVALEADFPERFHSTMRLCRRLSSSASEVDGLDALLTLPEQLLHDVSIEREARCASQGYVTPADARAFLQAARRSPSGPWPEDPIAAAYLRPPEAEVAPGVPAGTPGGDAEHTPVSSDTRQAIMAVADCLAGAGVVPGRPRALLAANAEGSSRPSRLGALLEHVRLTDEPAFLARGRELAFLANCLVAGCSVQTRGFTAPEASDAVVAACELGLEHWPARWPGTGECSGPGAVPDTFLLDHDLIEAFRVGWAVLHEASLEASERLIAAVADLHVDDAAIERALGALARELAAQCGRGTPWHARDALDIVATFDVATWAAMLGLLDECPILPAALPAVVEGRKGAVSATAFDFVSTRAQLEQIRGFLDRLPELLVP